MKIFLIGPGGVGKTTCGRILAELLDFDFVDLDTEFCNRIENITTFIRTKGYEKYCSENSKLFYELLKISNDNCVFALSSGFLIHESLGSKHKQILESSGISVLLLPSSLLEESTEIIVKRQLKRGFGLKEGREREKFTERFPIYKKFGDIKIFSQETPEVIAKQIKKELLRLTTTL